MKKELYIPLLVLLLTIAFGSVCFLMFFFNNNKRLISWKMKLGGLLLMLSAMAGKGYGDEVITSCYMIPSKSTIPYSFSLNFGSNISILKNKSNFNSPLNFTDNYTGTNFFIGMEFNHTLDHHDFRRPRSYVYTTLDFEKITPRRNLTTTDNNIISTLTEGNPSNLSITQEINLSYVNLGAGYKFVYRNIFISAGIESSYILFNEKNEIIEIKDNNSIFKNNITGYDRVNDKRIELSNKTINNLNKFKFGLPISIGFNFYNYHKIDFNFIGTYCLPLTNLIKNEDSKIQLFRVGININWFYKRFENYL